VWCVCMRVCVCVCVYGWRLLMWVLFCCMKNVKTTDAPAQKTKPPPSLEHSFSVHVVETNTSKQNAIWFYLDADQSRHGPLTESQLCKMFGERSIQESTLMWNQSLSGWTALKDIQQLFTIISKPNIPRQIPDPPPSQQVYQQPGMYV